jgi:Flp pilus assembly protein TadD
LLAEAYRVQGRHANTVEELSKALELAPGDARLKQQLAAALWRTRNYEAALPLLQQFHAEDPDLEFALGDTLMNTGETQKAIVPLEAAIQRKPTLLEAHRALGTAYMNLGNAELAAVHLRAAARSDVDGTIHYQLARALERAGKQDESRRAMVEYQRLAAVDEQRQKMTQAGITAP